MYTASLNLDIELPADLTFTSLSNYQTEEQKSVMDYDLTNVDAYWAESLRDQDTITQEFRLASDPNQRLRWMTGVYYLEQDYYTQARFAYGTLPAFRAAGLTGTATAPQPNPKEVENRAVFASVSFNVTDRFEVALEGRYQNDKITAPAQGVTVPRFVVESSAFLPRLLLKFNADDATNLYLNVAKGNQPTQGNPQLQFLAPERRAELATSWGIPLVVPESRILNYEVGLKKTLADGRANFNTALFYSQWSDKQDTKSALIDFNGNGVVDLGLGGANRESFSGQAAVAGDEDVYGVEIETRFLVTSALEIGGAATWTKVDFKPGATSNLVYRFFGGDAITQTAQIDGRKEGFIPDLSATAYLQYRAALTGSLDWRARGRHLCGLEVRLAAQCSRDRRLLRSQCLVRNRSRPVGSVVVGAQPARRRYARVDFLSGRCVGRSARIPSLLGSSSAAFPPSDWYGSELSVLSHGGKECRRSTIIWSVAATRYLSERSGWPPPSVRPR